MCTRARARSPTELWLAPVCMQLRELNFENNYLSGSIPPSLVECAALVDTYRAMRRNLDRSRGDDQAQDIPHAVQRYHPDVHPDPPMRPEWDGKNGLQGSTIPIAQRTRKFRSRLPSVEKEVGKPSFVVNEMRDICLFSPNQIMRCGVPGDVDFDKWLSGLDLKTNRDAVFAAAGPSTTHLDALAYGGLTRCEQTYEQHTPAGYDIQVPFSMQQNHRVIDTGPTHTEVQGWPPGGRWSRPPHAHEAAEKVTPLGPGGELKLPG